MLKYLVVMLLWFVFIVGKNKIYKKDYPYYKLLFVFLLFLILDIFVSFFGPLVWFVGITAYIGFLIFIFVVPKVFDKQSKIDCFIDYFIYLCVPIFILGFIQFFLPPTHFLNTYASEMDSIAVASGFVRVTSIFNYITGYTTFLTFAIPFIFFKLVYAKGKNKFFLFILFLLGMFNLFATGSRGSTAVTLLSLLFMSMWLLIKSEKKIKYEFLIFITLAFVIVSGLIYTDVLVIKSFETIMTRTREVGGEEVIGRVVDLFITPFKYANIAGMGGFGIGSTHQIANALGYDLNTIYDVPYEESLERYVLEMGVFGTLIFVTLKLWIMYDLLKKIHSLINKYNAFLAFTFFITILQYFIYANNIVFNWMGAVEFWLSIGMIIAITKNERNIKLLDEKKNVL